LNYFASVPKLAFYERVFEQIYGLFRDSPPLLDNPVAIVPPIPIIWCQLFRLYCAIIKCLLN